MVGQSILVPRSPRGIFSGHGQLKALKALAHDFSQVRVSGCTLRVRDTKGAPPTTYTLPILGS